jgi:hypothetical protein
MDETERTLPVDAGRIQEFNRVLERYRSGKRGLEKRVVTAENWWKLRNEAEAKKQNGIDWDDSFRAKSAWLHNVIVSKHADAMENYPEPLVLPREPGDREQARLLSAVLPVVLEQAHFESVYDANMWQKLKTGTGVYKIVWDAGKLGGLGDIDIQRVDLLSVFWEPGVTDIQKSRYLFHVELQDNEVLESQYPALLALSPTSPDSSWNLSMSSTTCCGNTIVRGSLRMFQLCRTTLVSRTYVFIVNASGATDFDWN